jgi:hypothetical protein
MVQVAVEDLAGALDRPVLIEDSRHQPLWWSAQDAVDGARLRSILNRTVHPAAIAMVARLGLPRATGPVRTPAVPEAEMLARWCVPLRAGTTLLGYLWVLDGEGTLAETDLAPVLDCAARATAVLRTTIAADDAHADRRDALVRRLAGTRDVTALDDLVALERLDADALVIVHSPRRPGGWDLDGDLSVHVVDALRGSAFVGGTTAGSPIGGAPVLLADLHLAVQRARVTLRVLRAGAVLERPSWEALGAWRLIVAVPEEVTPADIHPGAQALSALSRPDLLTTAWTVLERGGDVAGSAAALHIHRTTLYYRLDRIAALTGVDLRTGAHRLDLHLALRLAAYRRADSG